MEILQVSNPDNRNWTQTWYGLPRLTECKSIVANNRADKDIDKAHNSGVLYEREYEIECFKKIVSYIQSKEAVFMEVGAGYGEWCLAFQGVLKNKLVETKVQEVRCYAVEAEPQHFRWCTDHFLTHNLLGNVIYGAVSDKNGKAKFSIDQHPADCYGQSITRGNGIIRTIGNIIKRDSIVVPTYTIDTIFLNYDINHVDLMHIDIQGAEYRILKGMKRALDLKRIDVFMIGTHNPKWNDKIIDALEADYKVLLNIKPRTKTEDVACGDGMLILQGRWLIE